MNFLEFIDADIDKYLVEPLVSDPIMKKFIETKMQDPEACKDYLYVSSLFCSELNGLSTGLNQRSRQVFREYLFVKVKERL